MGQPILLIDGLNLFIRCWAAYPTMSIHGGQLGGTIGFIKTLTSISNQLVPSKVFVAWEGGGSIRRRQLLPSYKAGRRPDKLNRFYGDDIPETSENRTYQLRALVSLLHSVPVRQFYVENTEADDVIAYLCKKYKSEEKVIVSSDSDYHQLIDEVTRQYNPIRKQFVTLADVKDRFGVPAQNYALAKSVCGDRTDGIEGVGRIGYKSLIKHAPILLGESSVLVSDFLSFCAARSAEDGVCKKIYDMKDVVNLNWRLVSLDSGNLSAAHVSKIEHALVSQVDVSRLKYVSKLQEIGSNLDPNEIFFSLKCAKL